MILKNRKKINF